jgi:UPF0176 protein
MTYQVILYYQFARIESLQSFWKEHKQVCQTLGLKGRIYIASEGINGTLAGTTEQITAYKQFLWSKSGFEQTAFKDDSSDYIPFDKLIVRIRPEIVALKSSVEVDPTKEQAPHLEPHEWRQALESKEPYTLIDVRNNYESAIGHFEGAIRPDVENFFDFEKWLDEARLEKDKKVLMYCTGGIRCEKFSLLMKKKGYENIYQLQGGIINYAQKENGAHYKGKCFVFDDRLAIPVEPNQKEPLTECSITGIPCDTYLNCANLECNKMFLCSTEGAQTYQGSCCESCMKAAAKKRPFDPEHIYAPTLKWHRYRQTEKVDQT